MKIPLPFTPLAGNKEHDILLIVIACMNEAPLRHVILVNFERSKLSLSECLAGTPACMRRWCLPEEEGDLWEDRAQIGCPSCRFGRNFRPLCAWWHLMWWQWYAPMSNVRAKCFAWSLVINIIVWSCYDHLLLIHRSKQIFERIGKESKGIAPENYSLALTAKYTLLMLSLEAKYS